MLLFKICLFSVALLVVYNIQTAHSQKFGDDSLSNQQAPLESCLVPTGRVSYCVPLHRCKQIKALFKSLRKPRSRDVTNFLTSSFRCPNKTSSEKRRVCCPVESIIKPQLPQLPRFGNTGNKLYKIYVEVW